MSSKCINDCITILKEHQNPSIISDFIVKVPHFLNLFWRNTKHISMGINLASVHLDKNQRYGCFFCMGSDANFRIILHLFVILIYPMAEFSIASYYLLTLSAYPIFDIIKNRRLFNKKIVCYKNWDVKNVYIWGKQRFLILLVHTKNPPEIIAKDHYCHCYTGKHCTFDFSIAENCQTK